MFEGVCVCMCVCVCVCVTPAGPSGQMPLRRHMRISMFDMLHVYYSRLMLIFEGGYCQVKSCPYLHVAVCFDRDFCLMDWGKDQYGLQYGLEAGSNGLLEREQSRNASALTLCDAQYFCLLARPHVGASASQSC